MAAKHVTRSAKTKRRVLVVAGQPVFGEVLVRLINAEKDLVARGMVGNGRQALHEIRRYQPDLALIDLGSPENSALNLIKRARFLKIPLKLLVVSIHDKAIYAQRVLRAGADGYVLKNEDPLEIINAIRDVLKSRLYVSDGVLGSGSSKPSSAAKSGALDTLMNSDLEILSLLGEGQSKEEMANYFRMSADEVNARCIQIQRKLQLKSMNALIRYAVCWVEAIRR